MLEIYNLIVDSFCSSVFIRVIDYTLAVHVIDKSSSKHNFPHLMMLTNTIMGLGRIQNCTGIGGEGTSFGKCLKLKSSEERSQVTVLFLPDCDG